MPVRSDEPLRKVTLNLYEADCQWMEREYGHGWTERLRQMLHHEVTQRKPYDSKYDEFQRKQHQKVLRTLGDLPHD